MRVGGEMGERTLPIEGACGLERELESPVNPHDGRPPSEKEFPRANRKCRERGGVCFVKCADNQADASLFPESDVSPHRSASRRTHGFLHWSREHSRQRNRKGLLKKGLLSFGMSVTEEKDTGTVGEKAPAYSPYAEVSRGGSGLR